eukprot:31270-Pelagococcus_subviridis.AAC.2
MRNPQYAFSIDGIGTVHAAMVACHPGTAAQSAFTYDRYRSGMTATRAPKNETTNASWTNSPAGVFIVPSVSIDPRRDSQKLLCSESMNQFTKYTNARFKMATGQNKMDKT